MRYGSRHGSLLLLVGAFYQSSEAWTSNGSGSKRNCQTRLAATTANEDGTRRVFITTSVALLGASLCGASLPANALVKGNAPPPKMKPIGSGRPTCTNIDECQSLAEKREQEMLGEQGPPPEVTAGGTRYRDMEEGQGTAVVKDGDEVKLFYKVLKLGKRSYDGLSGEGTVVFSRGYGYEDDEKKPGDKTFDTVVGNYQNIAAMNDALIGMKVGQVRRFAVLPQKGWRKPTKVCDGGPGGQGTGGDLKTDYVVVPTATMVAEEACFDTTKIPFPTTYAQQRRMAQRFDQSLIMEAQIVDILGTSSM